MGSPPRKSARLTLMSSKQTDGSENDVIPFKDMNEPTAPETGRPVRKITRRAEVVLEKMDTCRLRSRRLKGGRICSIAERKRSRRGATRTAVSPENESLDDEGEESVTDEEEDEADDGDGDEHKEDSERSGVRQKKTALRYKAEPWKWPPLPCRFFNHTTRHTSSTRGSYRISASVPRSPYTTSRRSGRVGSILGRRKHTWHRREASSSDEDSDEEDAEQSCQPLNLRTEGSERSRRDRMKMGGSLADVDPMDIDQSVCFDSVGGLTSHIASLKEMVVFPLIYPEVFDRFKIQPPRGCLFYGPPGTGKTLVARALANECSHGDRKVNFFMRKGADCLSKWVGESERSLRLLFKQAYQMRPSIIFFDEIDGLAPVRSSRQDQIHSSIVSTLLSLMDGLDSRGEVVVIGATNRLDAIDPALRRPGRFDREFLFGLPDRESRRDILKIHTQQWDPLPSDAFLDELADKCVGYCGADIKAVCAEAALCALRRLYPQIYGTSQKLLLDVDAISIGCRDFLAAMAKTVAASQRTGSSPARALAPALQPLLGPALDALLDDLQKLFPHAQQGLKRKREPTCSVLEDELMYGGDEGPSSCSISQQTPPRGSFFHLAMSAASHPTSHRPRLLLAGGPGAGQSSHLAPAVLHALERLSVFTLDLTALLSGSTSPEEACAQVFSEARRSPPSVVFLPHLQAWWEASGSALRASFLSQLDDLPSFCPILLLATADLTHRDLAHEIQALFRVEYGEVFSVQTPTAPERTAFLQDLILSQAAKAPVCRKKALMRAMEVLPLAPPPPPRQMSERERWLLQEQEEDTLRELRNFLRDVAERLCQDKRFRAFTKPVDIEEVPDYLTVIQHPMDLSSLLSKIDRQRYVTVREFVHDVDLIWKNALEYNPDTDPSDRQIRHRANALKDTVHAIIRHELSEDLERSCEKIRESRTKRAGAVLCDGGELSPLSAPSHCQTPPRDSEPQSLSPAHDAGTPRHAQRRLGRVTRATRTLAQQQQLITEDEALEILSQKTQNTVVDHHQLQELLERAVLNTEGAEVCQLEKLYALLCQSIYRHRKNHNKTELFQEMKREIDSFS